MKDKNNETIDGVIACAMEELLSQIREAYDCFMKDVETNWDSYFRLHAAQLISKKESLALNSLNRTVREQASRKVEEAIYQYIDSHAEGLKKKSI